ncbi:MAG: HAD family hydrolase [Actinobacteria bacterium]|nr:MAG: HAD family hydrolase [Actinomycetota bacterium]
MRLKAVFFDVGNTLLAPFPSVSEVCRQVLAEAGHVHDLSAIDALMPLVDEYYEDRYRADDTFWTDEEETSSVWVGMYSLMCRRLGIEEDAALLARRVYDEFGKPDRWSVYADVLPALDRLRALDMRLGIISNWDRRLVGLLDALGIRERVDVILSSAEVGLRKPDPRIFELACERLEVAPDEAAHVGDHHYSDILGARAVGMTPVLVDRSGRVALPIGPIPITDFDSLERVLELS